MDQKLTVIVKPVSSRCNHACDYCLNVAGGVNGRVVAPNMNLRLVEAFTEQCLKLPIQRVYFLWHGGEPTLAGLDFYREAVSIQQAIFSGSSLKVTNGIQTNGSLLTKEWMIFLKEKRWRVGISIDGPKDMHNAFRRDKSGEGTFESAFSAYVMMRQAGVKVGVSAVVNSVSVKQPDKFYRFFRQHFGSFSFEPCFAPDGIERRPFSILPEDYADFVCRVFDLWWEEDDPSVRIRTLRSYVEAAVGKQPTLCSMSNGCGRFLEIEADGTAYPCGRMSGYLGVILGNLGTEPLSQIVSGRRRQDYLSRALYLPSVCLKCPWLTACHNGCSFHRYLGDGVLAEKTPACEAVRKIMKHISARVLEVQS